MILANLFSRIFSHTAPRIRVIDRRAFDSTLQRGYRSQCAGNEARAEKLYRRALQIDSESIDAHYLLGALLGKKGELHDAIALLQHAIEAKADFAEAHAALGNVYLLQKCNQAAAASYREAIRLDPENVPAHSNLGLIYKTDGNHAAALECFTRAFDLAPQRPEALKNMALEWIELGQFEHALSQLHRLLHERPDSYEVLICLGFTLQKMHRPDEALDFYLRARAQNSSDAELLNNLGIVLQDLGRIEEAITSYDRAIALKPDFEAASWHRALAYLLRHDFARGWADYDLRLVSIEPPPRPALYPRWDGNGLCGRRILVYAEQGLGDEIMFSSCLPQVIAASSHCVVECSPKLEALFRRSFPAATVYAMTAARDFPPVVQATNVELQIAMGSLPQFLRRARADFPPHRGYLVADPQRVAHWRARLEALGRGLKVGISWQGGTQKTRSPLRSLPLAQWLPILRTPEVTFINLQYTESNDEIAGIRACAGIKVVDWPDARDDYDQTAALVSALDLVISVCTAVIHLGGALGKPVWVLAPFSPEWRYGIAGEKMPWYPSVRVFRQPSFAAWAPVVDAVAQSLTSFSGACRNVDPDERSTAKHGSDVNYSRVNPSTRYLDLLSMYSQMHQTGEKFLGVLPENTFPGKSLMPQVGRIKDLIIRTGAQTILDYGCGKGQQYGPQTISDASGQHWPGVIDYWEVDEVVCYDPCHEPYRKLPEGKFDGVISTDVLEHCPEDDVPWIVEEIFGYAMRFVFANVACYPARKRLPNGENAHCTIKPAEWWQELVGGIAARHPGVVWEFWLQFRVDTAAGTRMVEKKIGG